MTNTPIKLTRKEITIKVASYTGHGHEEVEDKKVMAWVYNQIAAHKIFGKWQLTHVPTGYQIIGLHNVKYNSIRPLVEEVYKLCDWGISDVEPMGKHIQNIKWEIRSIIDKYQ